MKLNLPEIEDLRHPRRGGQTPPTGEACEIRNWTETEGRNDGQTDSC